MFSHVDDKNQPAMVDVTNKRPTKRTALAQSVVVLPQVVTRHFEQGDIQGPKGPVFQTAIVAGTLAAKKTHDLIPFCHPLGIENCQMDIQLVDKNRAVINCRVSVTHKTGVEMEALTGASIAALTIYDMCKGLSPDIAIRETRLLEKTGGKSDIKRD